MMRCKQGNGLWQKIEIPEGPLTHVETTLNVYIDQYPFGNKRRLARGLDYQAEDGDTIIRLNFIPDPNTYVTYSYAVKGV